MATKMIRLENPVTINHLGGRTLHKGTIFKWNEDTKRYHYEEHGKVVAVIEKATAEEYSENFKPIEDE